MSGSDQETVDVSGLEMALQDLVKAADATSLMKGANIEHSGHVDERGKVGGGITSDAGSLDDMMIGKLTEVGVPAELASEFAAFMRAKQEGDDDEGDDDEDDDDDEGEAPPPFAGKKKAKKSDQETPTLTKSIDELRRDADIEQAVDVSPFLEALTARMADQLDGIKKSHAGYASKQARVNQAQAAALYQMGTLLKSQAEVIDVLRQRLGIVERQPAPQRGATTTGQAAALAKSLPGEAGVGGAELRKSEVLAVLSYMNLEKGIKTINGQPTSESIYRLEGGNMLDESTMKAVQQFLRSHPTEAETARQYQ